jgi:hypothetical protein
MKMRGQKEPINKSDIFSFFWNKKGSCNYFTIDLRFFTIRTAEIIHNFLDCRWNFIGEYEGIQEPGLLSRYKNRTICQKNE